MKVNADIMHCVLDLFNEGPLAALRGSPEAADRGELEQNPFGGTYGSWVHETQRMCLEVL